LSGEEENNDIDLDAASPIWALAPRPRIFFRGKFLADPPTLNSTEAAYMDAMHYVE